MDNSPLDERGFLVVGGQISSLLHFDYALRGRHVLLRVDINAARVLMPITIAVRGIPVRLATLDAAAVSIRDVHVVVTLRLYCVSSHCGSETRVTHIGRRGLMVAVTVWRYDRATAEIAMKVLAKNARHAVQGNRIGARIQETN